MTTVFDLASVLRSKNAGPLYLTVDIIFDEPEKYDRVVESGAINPATICSAC